MTHSAKTTAAGATIALLLAIAATPDPAAAGDMPFMGEVIRVPFNFCPVGTLEANGQLLPIDDYSALFALLGTTYGGDGQTSFALPDLRSRAPLGADGTSFPLGQKNGQEQVTLTLGQMAPHSHDVRATKSDGDKPGPSNRLLGAAPSGGVGQETIYSDQPPTNTMSLFMISTTGLSQSFSVLDPFVTIRYCVATDGIFPSRS